MAYLTLTYFSLTFKKCSVSFVCDVCVSVEVHVEVADTS